MFSLGVNIAHDRGAALVQDGRIVVAISLERLDRKKHSSGVTVPLEAIEYCLEYAGVSSQDIDVVGYNYPHHLVAYPAADKLRSDLHDLFPRCSSRFVPHHLAHACSTFYASPFDDAVVLVIDGAGNKMIGETEEFYRRWDDGSLGSAAEIKGAIESETGFVFSSSFSKSIFRRWQTREGNDQVISLGRLYWEACLLLGMGILDGGKLMGLSSYGKSSLVPSILGYGHADTGFNLDLEKLQVMSKESFELKAQLAYVTQYTLEHFVLEIVRRLHRINPCPNICLAGGVALNSVVNEKIIHETSFEKIFVAPASDDSGIALGCAYFGCYHLHNCEIRASYCPYLGKIYSTDSIVASLGGMTYSESSNVALAAAQFIADGKIVAWFQGASEYGPRALGNRSILCDPRYVGMKAVLNNQVKHRESYRPFAPAVLNSRLGDYFDIVPSSGSYEYMTRVVNVLCTKLKDLAAVTHVDGSARVQTVSPESNPLFHSLIVCFENLTGIPVVLNTSFNVAGDPIVETPQDAVHCFSNTQIDVLIIGNYIVERIKQEGIFGV